MTTEHTILALCKRSYEIAAAHGFTAKEGPSPFYRDANLIQSETSEALEDFRANRGLDEIYYTYKEGGISMTLESGSFKLSEMTPESRKALKPCGIPSELADVVIRVCHRCEADGTAEMLEEMFNGWKFVDGYNHDFELMLATVNYYVSQAFQLSISEALPAVKRGSVVYQLASALRHIFAFCKMNNIDLWAAIDEKEAYNRNRPFKHGKQF